MIGEAVNNIPDDYHMVAGDWYVNFKNKKTKENTLIKVIINQKMLFKDFMLRFDDEIVSILRVR